MADQDIFLSSIPTHQENCSAFFVIKASILLEMVDLKTNCQSVKGSLPMKNWDLNFFFKSDSFFYAAQFHYH